MQKHRPLLSAQNRKSIFCFLIALTSLYSIDYMFKIDITDFAISNSIISLFLLLGIYILLKKSSSTINRRMAVISCILGFIFSTSMICGSAILKNDSTLINQLRTWIKILCATPIFASFTVLFLKYFPQLNAHFSGTRLSAVTNKITAKKAFFLCWLLIFFAWIPGLIASYPGIYGYDSVYQISFYLSGKINLHHPLIHTYLLGFFVITLGDLLNSREFGFCLYALFQMICLSGAFAAICAWLRRQKIRASLRLLCLGFFMFFPLNALMSFSSTKDILFSAIFTMLILYTLEMVRDDTWILKRANCIKFILTGFLLIIFRSQGIYIFIIGMVIGFILLRKHWKRLSVLILSCFILYGIYAGPITSLAGGFATDSIHEMMSVPCMQISRAMLYNADDLTEQEKELVEIYIPNYSAYKKDKSISDIMKGSFNTERFKENPSEFIKLWFQIGKKCPLTYTDAFARLTIGLWYPDMNYRDPGAYHPYWEYISTQQNPQQSWVVLERHTPACLIWLSDFYQKITYENTYQSIPIVSLLFSSGFMVWCMFLFIGWCIYVKKYKYLFPGALVMSLWLTLILGPVVLYRYVFPIAMTIPLLFGVIISENETEYSKNQEA